MTRAPILVLAGLLCALPARADLHVTEFWVDEAGATHIPFAFINDTGRTLRSLHLTCEYVDRNERVLRSSSALIAPSLGPGESVEDTYIDTGSADYEHVLCEVVEAQGRA